MAKKRTREQKINAAVYRETISYEPESPSSPAPKQRQPEFTPVSSRRDFVKTLVSTLIVLGVLLSIFVYTKIL